MIDGNGSTHKYSISISANFALLCPADCTRDTLSCRCDFAKFQIGSLDFSFFLFFFKKKDTAKTQASISLREMSRMNSFGRDRKKRTSESGRLISSELLFQGGRRESGQVIRWCRLYRTSRGLLGEARAAQKGGEDESPPENARGQMGTLSRLCRPVPGATGR